MNLKTYLNSLEFGGRAKFARRLGINPAYLYQLENGIRRVSFERCIAIEKASDGAVRCEDLRQDIDWAMLRRRNADAA